MPAELCRPSWELPPLCAAETGPYGDFPRFSDADKAAVWELYRAGRPRRVPVTLGINNRLLLMDPRIDAGGLTFERVFTDPEAMLLAQVRFQYLGRQRYNLFTDSPTALPETWEIAPDFQNVHDAAALGAPIHFHAAGIPETEPICAGDNKRGVFAFDLDRPLENAFFRRAHAMYESMRALAGGHTFLGRPIYVGPYADLGNDGPLTVALNLRGPAVLTDFRRDPTYVRELLDFLLTAFLRRLAALRAFYDLPAPAEVWLADDSIALLSPAQYREFVLPLHRKWYDTLDPQHAHKRCMHLCGDATRHFRTLRDECGVTCFDTGFPVDFAGLRRELGPDVEILGGVEITRLLADTPEQVYARAREILQSGILVGGRFVLHEANNLPPGVPWANLAAMYKAGLDYGTLPAAGRA
jgi:hypothetical protein